MKLLLISDLHANPYGANAILQAEQNVDAIYCAGDYVDYGTEPAKTVEWVQQHQVNCIYGNHDEKVIKEWENRAYMTRPETGYMWSHLNCQRMEQKHIDFLKALPAHLSFVADGVEYLMQHSFYLDRERRYLMPETQYAFDKYWEEHYSLPEIPGAERRMIFGHTHRQMMAGFGNNSLWLNPGSTSYRRRDDPSKAAFYAVIENGVISMRHIDYDTAPLVQGVQAVKDILQPREYAIGNFYYGWKEEDGPNEDYVSWPVHK